MRAVRIKDTLSGELTELDGTREVGIYACGPTVYGRIHIGNARPFVVFSLLGRFLRREGYRTRLVINVTDINDKIYAAATDAGISSERLAQEMTDAYVADTGRLGLGRPDAEPLATETMSEIVELIDRLVESGHAYESGGDVYFRVSAFAGYGRLSNRDIDTMDQGEEAGSAKLKESRLDFALWKASKEGEDTAWDSPWGRGRPGWHIECSAMAEAELGPSFAIHGGGSDLVFPHHENEIAQSEAAREQPLAQIWMHNGMVLAGPEAKMAKSDGNVFLLHEAIEAYGPETVVDFLISGHYRQPLAFGTEQLDQAAARTTRVRNFLRERRRSEEGGGARDPFVDSSRGAFLDALADDFNTPRAMAALFELITEANRRELPGVHDAVVEMLEVVGLASLADAGELPGAESSALLAQREAARGSKDFAKADAIRDELSERGWDVRDSPDGAHLVRRD